MGQSVYRWTPSCEWGFYMDSFIAASRSKCCSGVVEEIAQGCLLFFVCVWVPCTGCKRTPCFFFQGPIHPDTYIWWTDEATASIKCGENTVSSSVVAKGRWVVFWTKRRLILSPHWWKPGTCEWKEVIFGGRKWYKSLENTYLQLEYYRSTQHMIFWSLIV